MAASARTYGDLPENVLDFLSSFDGIEYVGGFVGRYVSGGSPEAETNVLHLVDEVALGNEPLSAVPDRLKEYLSIDDAAARTAAAELVAARVLPIAALVGLDAETQLVAWGADPLSYDQVARVPGLQETPVRPDSDSTFFSDPVLQHRLELIVGSFRTGVRTREQAVAVLMRPMKTGGLEMTDEEATQSLDLVRLPAPATEPTSPEPVQPSEEPQPSIPETITPPPDTFADDDAAEIQRIADEKRSVIEQPSLITDTKAAAEKIIAEAKLAFANGELRTRFEHIIDARLRDVRDGFQTRAKLEAPAEQGGIGLGGAQLVAVMEAVERMDAGHHEALERQMVEKKAQFASDRKEKTDQDAKVRAREEQVMAKRYAEITGKAPTELVGPPPGRATAAPAAQAVAERERKIDAAKVRAVVEAAKADDLTPPPIMSEPTIPTAPSGRPKVEDIRFERKLAGPVEELRLLNLTDFRRFSTDPAQAVLKIRDRVDLVSQEGYDQRIAAIKAWRASPLSLMYVSLSREALLSGKGIRQVLEEKRASGEDVLTDAELATIVELNGVLRF